MSAAQLLSTSEVARRLGVKRETVYAYVSRGLLERHGSSRHRGSQFDAAEVERLAGRARRGDRSRALEVVIETKLSDLDPEGRLFYRGHDAVQLARFRSLEDVAGLLWDGDAGAPWVLDEADRGLIDSLQHILPSGTAAARHVSVAVAALGAADASPADRRPEAVRRAGARMCAGALHTVGGHAEAPAAGAAARLWPALRPDGARPHPAQLAALNAALVLLADHELAASTLAARVAASAWADPYQAVLSGLGPLGGALHGAASIAVQAMLEQVSSPEVAFSAVESRAAVGAVPGFGHSVYRDRDPRADHLLSRISAVADARGRGAIVEAVLHAARCLELPAPNADFGLSALAFAMGLRADGAMTIFTIGRMVGLVAHVIEEYPHRLRFRPRATYVGTVRRG